MKETTIEKTSQQPSPEVLREVMKENERRNAALNAPYDPLTGLGCAGRRMRRGECYVPQALLDECPGWDALPAEQRHRSRIKHDFEYWAATCATITDKESGAAHRFLLNAPQRRLVAVMERQRQSGAPVRVILLKARQWGGSTVVQMYMAWMQLVRHTGWNSFICGHVQHAARNIKAMWNVLLRDYPADVAGDTPLALKGFEGSRDMQQLVGRDCVMIMGTAGSEDSLRGFNVKMAHLTEVAFWPDNRGHSPESVMRSVYGTVLPQADSVVVLESTAHGMGDFFHREWVRAVAGESDKEAVFVPWHEIESYRKPVDDVRALWASLTDYERELWQQGLTLEMINWYHCKSLECETPSAMFGEFPTTDEEAFAYSGRRIFDDDLVASLQATVEEPAVDAGRLGFDDGRWLVWHGPQPGRQYVVGLLLASESGDEASAIVVGERGIDGAPHRVVACWRHTAFIDHVVSQACLAARIFNNGYIYFGALRECDERYVAHWGLKNGLKRLVAVGRCVQGDDKLAVLLTNMHLLVRNGRCLVASDAIVQAMCGLRSDARREMAAAAQGDLPLVLATASMLWAMEYDLRSGRHLTEADKRALFGKSLVMARKND